MPNPPVSQGTEIDQSSDYFRYWPRGRPALAKINDKLILAIPPQYQRFWRQKDNVYRAPMAIEKIPLAPVVGFSFFLPDFSGYTSNNYEMTFDPDRVDVVSLEPSDPSQAEQNAPGAYPPNMLKRLLNAGVKGEPHELNGLACYQPLGQWQPVLTCYGRSDEKLKEDIMLDVYVSQNEPRVTNPYMQALYFTKRYGGLQIIWRTHSKNFARWHDIDAQIWQFLDSWNIAGSAQPAAKRSQLSCCLT